VPGIAAAANNAAAVVKRKMMENMLLLLNVPSNAGLQLRRESSIQAEGKKLLEKHAIAPSDARLC
jgi:hypothetical protein